MRRKTHEEYVAELAIKNPTVEVVEKYVNAKTKIMHHCLIHDVYWKIAPDSALNGSGCPKCHVERFAQTKTHTTEQYISALSVVNSNIVVLGEYIDAKTPILHKCLIHDVEWMAMPTNMYKGQGCPQCGNDKIREKLLKTHEQYVSELYIVNPNIVVVGQYIDGLTPILHECLMDGNQWLASPANTLSGCGCPQCNESKGERRIRLWLDRHCINYIYQKIFNDCKDKRPLPFDFYLPDYNVCIEFDGRQHYEPVDYFGGKESFEYTIKHDETKTNYCKQNNIRLLRIRYDKDIEETLINFLFI